MGLLDRAPVRESGHPCLFGRILLRETPNADGEYLDEGDVEEMIRRRHSGHGSSRLSVPIFDAGFRCGDTAIARHIAGRCHCSPDTPMFAQKIGLSNDSHP